MRCPRGARPGDVLAAIRQQTIQHYAIPRAVGRWVNSVRATPFMLLLVPALLLAAALLGVGRLAGGRSTRPCGEGLVESRDQRRLESSGV
jgi:ABC-type methionine transport system permease subunit